MSSAISVLANMPERSPDWLRAEAMLRDRLGTTVAVSYDRDGMVAQIGGATILATFSLPQDIACAATALRWIHCWGSGVDKIARPNGTDIFLTNSIGVNTDAVAEAVLAQVLAHNRGLPHYINAQRRCAWESRPARLLKGSRAAIVGSGAIAKGVARRLRAFDVEVVAFTGAVRPMAEFDDVQSRDTLHAAVGTFDMLILLTALDASSRDLVDENMIRAMRDGCLLINASRGELVVEGALLHAVQAKRIFASLDVFREEPLPPQNPLWAQENVMLTPHSSGIFSGYGVAAASLFLENFRLFAGGSTSNMYNPAVFPRI